MGVFLKFFQNVLMRHFLTTQQFSFKMERLIRNYSGNQTSINCQPHQHWNHIQRHNNNCYIVRNGWVECSRNILKLSSFFKINQSMNPITANLLLKIHTRTCKFTVFINENSQNFTSFSILKTPVSFFEYINAFLTQI